ncbi:MAG: endonuclease/exonuclease/phosphatase family protein [Akkermansiaceae bacterium]|jgi:endonuclease/exonuclease/phosphatase family metal-dependent hydrolase|nr:endonuclease/exonuclease/phosphatase family protein [Luteolibacter sp.]
MPSIKSILLALFHELLLCSTATAEPLKAMSWNIRWFPGGYAEATKAEQTEHINAAQKIVAAADPDIFLAQEIRDETALKALIKNNPDLKIHVMSKFLNFEDKKPFPQQCAIASKLEAHSAFEVPYKFIKNLPSLNRGFAFAALKHPDGGLIMTYCVHLRSNRGSEDPKMEKIIATTRAEAIKQIIAHKNETAKKYADQKILGWVIGGDFNSNHDGQFPLCTAIADLTKSGFHNTWDQTPQKDRLTWRNNPRFEDYKSTTFDYIFTSGFTKKQATIFPNVSLKVSDHAPVVLELIIE